MGSTWLYLVRHGEQLAAPGDGDDPELGLSPAGQRQADLLGRRLARPARPALIAFNDTGHLAPA